MSFGGGFFGGGTSSSKQYTTNTYDTTTNTQIHDIGLTGQNAVDIANIVASIGDKGYDSLNKQTAQIGDSYNALIGGAGHMMDTAFGITDTLVKGSTKQTEAATEVSHAVLDSANAQASALKDQVTTISGNVLAAVRNAAERVLPNDVQDSKPIIIAAFGAVALIGIFMFARRA